jgi:hypothetical protein
MKFLVAAHFELGYSQEMLAEILGISQPAVSQELRYIRDVFIGRSRRSKQGKPYNPQKSIKTPNLRIEDVIGAVITLTAP